jgi:hypothetical protein
MEGDRVVGDHSRTSLRKTILVDAAIIIGVAGVITGGIVVFLPNNRGDRVLSTTVPDSSRIENRREDSPEPEPSKSSGPGVNPQCWANPGMARNMTCQLEVRDRTKFIQRYQDGLPDLARTHPVVAIDNTRRGRNSLAYHGLEICAETKDPSVSIPAMVVHFYSRYHPHTGHITDYNAQVAQAIAVQAICPDQSEAFTTKGGVL